MNHSWQDLDEQALLYVLGEHPDTAEFEALLERDQSSREAVAHAVELVEGVVSAPRAVPRTWGLRRVAAALIFCVGASAVAWWASRDEQRLEPVPVPAGDDVVAVISSWMDLSDVLEPEAPHDDESSLGDAGVEAPDWLVAAVGEERR